MSQRNSNCHYQGAASYLYSGNYPSPQTVQSIVLETIEKDIVPYLLHEYSTVCAVYCVSLYIVRVNVSKDPPLQNILTGAMQMIIFNLSEKVKDKFFNILIEVTHGFGWSLNYRSPWMFKSYSPGHREVDR